MVADRLPEKLSEVAELALADLRKVEEDPLYTVRMSTYHSPSETHACAVCLAGVVMAKTFEVDRDRDTWPQALYTEGSLSRDDRQRLHALDAFREGRLGTALDEIKAEDVDYDEVFLAMRLWDPPYVPYGLSPEGFRLWAEQAVAWLQERGL